MDDTVETFEIPADLVEEMKIAAPVLRATLSRATGAAVELCVIQRDAAGFAGAQPRTALMAVPVAVLALLSKKWLEEVAWPELKPRLKKPTRAGLEYLVSVVESHRGAGRRG
jgi:hypothetical protein